MVLHNPNNWHWVNKDASVWAKQWVEDSIKDVKAEEGGVTAQLDKVTSFDGDCDVSQRKGKVITIYDVKVIIEYSGKTNDDEDVSGTITIPEVAHDTEENDFIDTYSDANSKAPVKDLDIQHAPDENPSAGFPSLRTLVHEPSASKKTNSSSSESISTSAVNTTTVTDTEEFRAPASECYQTFTDPQRITAFTRAARSYSRVPRRVASSNCSVETFLGNISSWLSLPRLCKAGDWTNGQRDTTPILEINFDQNDVDNVTVMRVSWTGVPVGQEEVTKRNWKEYYIRSIKQTFGTNGKALTQYERYDIKTN
ncbi:activator of Hsp90 ATPase [Bisporella sp. PMI_857]|nr:activator of Hsp90 ATPase [Bisporella sp. PMI_857]KAH8600349.1 activator of Hsp90 ATPase [Bisporella sp. PMI_857]